PAGSRRGAGGAAHRPSSRRGLCIAAPWRRRCPERRNGSTVNTALKMISSMATRELLAQLAAGFTRETGIAVQPEAGGGVAVAKRISAGEHFDGVVLAANAIDQPVREPRVLGPRIRPVPT